VQMPIEVAVGGLVGGRSRGHGHAFAALGGPLAV
jgi:hypothetical protein